MPVEEGSEADRQESSPERQKEAVAGLGSHLTRLNQTTHQRPHWRPTIDEAPGRDESELGACSEAE